MSHIQCVACVLTIHSFTFSVTLCGGSASVPRRMGMVWSSDDQYLLQSDIPFSRRYSNLISSNCSGSIKM